MSAEEDSHDKARRNSTSRCSRPHSDVDRQRDRDVSTSDASEIFDRNLENALDIQRKRILEELVNATGSGF